MLTFDDLVLQLAIVMSILPNALTGLPVRYADFAGTCRSKPLNGKAKDKTVGARQYNTYK